MERSARPKQTYTNPKRKGIYKAQIRTVGKGKDNVVIQEGADDDTTTLLSCSASELSWEGGPINLQTHELPPLRAELRPLTLKGLSEYPNPVIESQ